MYRWIVVFAVSVCTVVACSSLPNDLTKENPRLSAVLKPLQPFLDKGEQLTYTEGLAALKAINQVDLSLQQYFAKESYACYDDFFVNLCLSPLEKKKRVWEARILLLKVQANALKRRKEMSDGLSRLKQRQAQSERPDVVENLELP